MVLAARKDEGDVERDASGGEFFESAEACGGGGDFDHAVRMSFGPLLAEFDVALGAFLDAERVVDVFEERIKFKADVACFAFAVFEGIAESVLGFRDELIGHLPGDFFVGKALVEEGLEIVVESAGFDEVRDDDRIAGRARSAVLFELGDEVGVDAIEPEFRAGGDEGFEWAGHGGEGEQGTGSREQTPFVAGNFRTGYNLRLTGSGFRIQPGKLETSGSRNGWDQHSFVFLHG